MFVDDITIPPKAVPCCEGSQNKLKPSAHWRRLEVREQARQCKQLSSVVKVMTMADARVIACSVHVTPGFISQHHLHDGRMILDSLRQALGGNAQVMLSGISLRALPSQKHRNLDRLGYSLSEQWVKKRTH